MAGEPTGLTATAHSGHVDLAWTNGASYTSMKVYRKISGGAYADIGAGISYPDNSYADGDTLSAGTYYWKIVTNLGDSNEASHTFTNWTASGTDTIDISDDKWVTVQFNVSKTDTFSVGEATEVVHDVGEPPEEPTPQEYTQDETDTVTMSDSYEIAHIGRQNWKLYFGSNAGDVSMYSSDYYGDGGDDIVAYFQTRALDFSDQYPDYIDAFKSITSVYLDYVDLIECPVTVSISTDNGTTWTNNSQTLGNGALTVKTARYDFAWVTGRFFVIKLSHSSSDRTFQFVKMRIDVEPHTDYFAVS